MDLVQGFQNLNIAGLQQDGTIPGQSQNDRRVSVERIFDGPATNSDRGEMFLNTLNQQDMGHPHVMAGEVQSQYSALQRDMIQQQQALHNLQNLALMLQQSSAYQAVIAQNLLDASRRMVSGPRVDGIPLQPYDPRYTPQIDPLMASRRRMPDPLFGSHDFGVANSEGIPIPYHTRPGYQLPSADPRLHNQEFVSERSEHYSISAPSASSFERPYQFTSGYIHLQTPPYPNLLSDLDRLCHVLQPDIKFESLDTQTLIDILVPRTASQIDALRCYYRARCGVDLATLLSSIVSGQKAWIKSAFIGLALGPALFDLWLIHVSP